MCMGRIEGGGVKIDLNNDVKKSKKAHCLWPSLSIMDAYCTLASVFQILQKKLKLIEKNVKLQRRGPWATSLRKSSNIFVKSYDYID